MPPMLQITSRKLSASPYKPSRSCKSASPKPADIVQAYELAGFSAQKRVQFKTAMEHFRAAEN